MIKRCGYHFTMIFLLVDSCLASGAGFTEVTDLDNRIETPAYSILPPQEAGWMYLRENPIKLSFGKLGPLESQSFSGMVSMSRMPVVETQEEFFVAISKQRA